MNTLIERLKYNGLFLKLFLSLRLSSQSQFLLRLRCQRSECRNAYLLIHLALQMQK